MNITNKKLKTNDRLGGYGKSVDFSSFFFSLEKCLFGTTNGVLLYVLKRELAFPWKNVDFELEMCVKERGGRAPCCMGSVPVAEMLASEARRSPPG